MSFKKDFQPGDALTSSFFNSLIEFIESIGESVSTAIQPAKLMEELNKKLDTINNLSSIESGAASGATAVQPSKLTEELNKKQDVINNLQTIESGAVAGATAIQPAKLTEELNKKLDSITAGSGLNFSGSTLSANIVTAWSASPLDTNIPSEKLLADDIAAFKKHILDYEKSILMTEVLRNQSYQKCDIIGSFVGSNPWNNTDGLSLVDAEKRSGDDYITATYQIMLENLGAGGEFKLVGCDDLNWYDGITHASTHNWNAYNNIGYDNLDNETKSQTFISSNNSNIRLNDAVAKGSQYYKVVCVIPNNDWSSASIHITKENY